jgi:hypothetical protein
LQCKAAAHPSDSDGFQTNSIRSRRPTVAATRVLRDDAEGCVGRRCGHDPDRRTMEDRAQRLIDHGLRNLERGRGQLFEHAGGSTRDHGLRRARPSASGTFFSAALKLERIDAMALVMPKVISVVARAAPANRRGVGTGGFFVSPGALVQCVLRAWLRHVVLQKCNVASFWQNAKFGCITPDPQPKVVSQFRRIRPRVQSIHRRLYNPVKGLRSGLDTVLKNNVIYQGYET